MCDQRRPSSRHPLRTWRHSRRRPENCFKGGRRPGSASKRKDFAGGPRARYASEKGSSRDRSGLEGVAAHGSQRSCADNRNPPRFRLRQCRRRPFERPGPRCCNTAPAKSRSLRKKTRKRIAVIISDTFGRPWRLGLTNVAIGASGVPVLLDLRGTRDRQGKPLTATILAIADELAAAAGLLMGKSEGSPVVLIRGYRFKPASELAASIIRPAGEDLFR